MTRKEIESLQSAIATERKKRKMTQSQLAKKLYISRSYLSHIETLDYAMTPEIAERVKEVFTNYFLPDEYIRSIRDSLKQASQCVEMGAQQDAAVNIEKALILLNGYAEMIS